MAYVCVSHKSLIYCSDLKWAQQRKCIKLPVGNFVLPPPTPLIFPPADVSVAHKNVLPVSVIKWHKLAVIYDQHNVWSCLMTILNNRKSFAAQIVTRILDKATD